MARSKAGGFALVEALVSAFATLAIVGGGITVSSLAFSRLWLQRSAYEAAICVASIASVDCESEFRLSVQAALPFGELDKFRIVKSTKQIEVEIIWKLAGEIPIKVERSVSIPLRKSRGRL